MMHRTEPTLPDQATVRRVLDSEQPSGRTAFIAIVWVAVAIGLVAQFTDGATAARNGAAVGVVAAAVAWLHVVHRIHQGTALPLRRAVVVLTGVYAALVALLAIDPAHFVFLFAAYALTFALVDELTPSIALSFIVTLIWVGGWVHHDLPTGALPTPVLVWVTLVAIVVVLDRVSSTSEERRRLLAELHATQVQLAESEHQRGALQERERLAAEIHDTLAQGFTSIVLLSEATIASPETQTSHLHMITDTARENLQATRRLVDGLRPIELDGLSLGDGVARVVERHRARWPERVELAVDGDIDDHTIDSDIEVTLLRVVQEALNNAAKHAQAELIDIEITCTSTHVCVTVSDDGVGFEMDGQPHDVAGGVGGRGLELMAARLEASGGDLNVTSRPGAGTTVDATAPMTNQGGPS